MTCEYGPRPPRLWGRKNGEGGKPLSYGEENGCRAQRDPGETNKLTDVPLGFG